MSERAEPSREPEPTAPPSTPDTAPTTASPGAGAPGPDEASLARFPSAPAGMPAPSTAATPTVASLPGDPQAFAVPSSFPWASLLITGAILVLAWLDSHRTGLGGHRLWQALGLSRDLVPSGELWRLVTGSFVHRSDMPHGMVGLATLFCVAFNLVPGARTSADRLLGAGGALFLFIVGGAAANLVRVFLEPPELFSSVPGGYPGGLALVAATAVAGRRAGLPSSGEISWLLYRVVFALFAVLACTDGFARPDKTAESVVHALPGILSGAAIGLVFALVVPPVQRRAAGSLLGPLLGLSALVVLLAGAVGAGVHHQRGLADRAFKVDPASELQLRDDAELGVSLLLPSSLHEREREKNHVAYAGLVTTLPQLQVYVGPRSSQGFDAPDTFMEIVLRELKKRDPEALELESPQPFRAGRLRGEKCALATIQGGNKMTMRLYVFMSREKTIQLIYYHDPEDDEAPEVADAIAASLKERGEPSDKSEKERPR
jgi:hypothetical protein